MTDIPIIMSAPMVLACLREAGHPGTGKTMTRRRLYSVRKLTKRGPSELEGHPPPYNADPETGWPRDHGPGECYDLTGWHKVKPGDRLWVREGLRLNEGDSWSYAADKTGVWLPDDDPRVGQMIGWAHHQERDHCTAIHMPRWASRLTLIVAATKIERLQDISEADALAEGLYRRDSGHLNWPPPLDLEGSWASPSAAFRWLWNYLHGAGSWDDNPEVVALTFKVIAANIDTPAAKVAA